MSYSLSYSKAVLVVIFISDKIHQKQYEFISSQMISETLDIPKPTLVKILQGLSSEGIIETKEGKQGGVRISRNLNDITLLDIFNAIERGKALFNSNLNIAVSGKRPDKAQESIKNVFSDAEQKMKEVLSKKTIQKILNEMNK
jgi:Rrf2 family protein